MGFSQGQFTPFMPTTKDIFAMPELSDKQQARADRQAQRKQRVSDTLSWLDKMGQAQLLRDKRVKSFDANDPDSVTNALGFDPRVYSIERIKQGAPMGVLGQYLPDNLLKQFSNEDLITMGKSTGDLDRFLGRLDVDRLRTFPAHIVAGLLSRNEEHIRKYAEPTSSIYRPELWNGPAYQKSLAPNT